MVQMVLLYFQIKRAVVLRERSNFLTDEWHIGGYIRIMQCELPIDSPSFGMIRL
jgi:hypothetical protein